MVSGKNVNILVEFRALQVEDCFINAIQLVEVGSHPFV